MRTRSVSREPVAVGGAGGVTRWPEVWKLLAYRFPISYLLSLCALFLALLCSYTLPGVAQARPPDVADLTGWVRDMGTGQPVIGAYMSTAGYSTLSDSAGRYLLLLPAGNYDLRIEAPGYIGMTRTRLQLDGRTQVRLDFEMIPEHPTPEEGAIMDGKMLRPAEQTPSEEELVRGFGLSSVTIVPTTIRVLVLDPEHPERDHTVITMNTDEYLKGVVPHEMPHSWSLEGLKAQAVAARSYAATSHNHLGEGKNGEDADVCNTTHCQVWDPLHYDSTDLAVDATHGMVATYNRAIIRAFFFASCAGHTYKCTECQDPVRKPWECWHSDLPYIQPVTCDPSVERIRQNPDAYYSQQRGHGHGMCQVGAADYGDPNKPWHWGYVDILKRYYTGVTVEAPIRIVSPSQGATVRGAIAAPVECSGSPTRVDCFLDEAWKTWSQDVPFVWKMSTAGLPDGPHTLRVVATLADGQTSQDEVPIIVDNTPPKGAKVSVPPWSNSTHIPFQLEAEGARWVRFSNDWFWEGENLSYQVGTIASDSEASAGKALYRQGGSGLGKRWYGPYTCDLPSPGSYQVYFRMKTPNRTLQHEMATIDVADNGGRTIYVERALSGEDFARNDAYEEFRLGLIYPDDATTCGNPTDRRGLEFRTLFRASGDLYLDRISVFSPLHVLGPEITWDVRPIEGAQTVVVRFLDDAGNSQDVPVTVNVDTGSPLWLSLEGSTALVQDTVSGLDLTSAVWAISTDRGRTWGDWQTFQTTLPSGIVTPVQLQASEVTGAMFKFRIRDRAGNISYSSKLELWLPLVSK